MGQKPPLPSHPADGLPPRITKGAAMVGARKSWRICAQLDGEPNGYFFFVNAQDCKGAIELVESDLVRHNICITSVEMMGEGRCTPRSRMS